MAWGLSRSDRTTELIAAPGNPGIAQFGEIVALDPTDADSVFDLAGRISADLVVIGPEAPLAAGVADVLRQTGFKVFGPDAAAARIEGSKAHAKELMLQAGIPTAQAADVTDMETAVRELDRIGPPFVIKADGLAAGKGVVVTEDRAEAVEALEERLVRGVFGEAGERVLIEEFLDGEELSLIAFCDGQHVLPCAPAQDYKRVGDQDRGPNTGGMGSYSPVPACPPELAEQIAREVLEPMAKMTAEKGAPFSGALYAGLALTSKGPRVIEFNARFGDPETQALIPRLRSDLAEVCLATATGSLDGVTLDWSPDVCVSLVLASAGYPGNYKTGLPIRGLEGDHHDAVVFHAGTRYQEGEVVTAGGRVLNVSALAPTFAQARARAYIAAAQIDFEGKYQRTDIALRAESAERSALL